MRIALDATPLTVTTGGIRRYTTELARALATEFPRDEIWLLSDQPFENPAPDLSNVLCGARPSNPIERRWWSYGLPRELARRRIEVFHGTDFAVPYLRTRPAVMTVHDLSPWLDFDSQPASQPQPVYRPPTEPRPKGAVPPARIRKRTPMMLRLGLANIIITPSEAIRREVIARFRLRPERVVAIPLAASDLFRPKVRKNDAGRYFLYVGTLEPRKNLRLLVESWREVCMAKNVKLKLVGTRRDDQPEIPSEPGLEVLGAVPDEELAALYSGAIACVYPSRYEGFGLPVLEAMQCGAAVITSRDAAISEVAGNSALQLDMDDAGAWVEALSEAASEPHWVAELREKGLKRAAEFSWSRTATRTHDVYRAAQVLAGAEK